MTINLINKIFFLGWFGKFLAWKGFLITTKLSYAIYLTQFPIFFYNVGSIRSAEHFEFFSMQVSCNINVCINILIINNLFLQFNLHELLWIIMLSITLTLLIDTPFQNIKNYLMTKSSMPKTTKLLKMQ